MSQQWHNSRHEESSDQKQEYRGLTWVRAGLVESVDREDSGWMTETEKPNDEPVTYF